MDDLVTLVLGATGSVGGRVAARLHDLGEPVRAASRHAGTRFDWADDTSWEPALAGAGRLFLMAPDGVDVDPAFVRLAADMKVGRVVLLSSRGIEAMRDERLLGAERLVRDSGLDWTIVRSDWFDQNFDEGPFRDAVLAGELSVPLADCRQTFVDLEDVAEVVVRALRDADHTGHTYEVTGPQALSFDQACALIAAATGRPVTFHGSPEHYRRSQTALGRPAEEVDVEIEAFAALRELGDSEPRDTVARLTGRPARTFEQYAAAAAAAGRWR
ncbi:NmrA family NAD(P)-binding protein [Micromonospora echinospora]|uniref:NmrA family NAD(P)-binding protein n=1 Tax=Micromonospora echinospora TaxID=1877 RepID=UPI0037949E5E